MFEETLLNNQLEIIKLCELDLILRIKHIIYLRILKMIHNTMGDSRMNTSMLASTLSEFVPTSDLEAEMIIATLIKEGYVKAYMSHKFGKTVFAKQDSFPNLEERK